MSQTCRDRVNSRRVRKELRRCCAPIGHNNTNHFLCPIRSQHSLDRLEMVRWESVPRSSSACAWKLSSRVFSRPDWLPVGLRGCLFTIKNIKLLLCVLSFEYALSLFRSPLPHKKCYVGVFSCHSSRMPFRNPLDETGLNKRKTKTISNTNYGNLPKVPLLFYSLRNRLNLSMWQRIGRERRICF